MKLRTLSYAGHISIAGEAPSGCYLPVTVSADLVGTDWWVCRALVSRPEDRRKGLGRSAVCALIEEWKTMRKPDERLFVAPGGYNTPWEVLQAFYESCGFVLLDAENGVMECPS